MSNDVKFPERGDPLQRLVNDGEAYARRLAAERGPRWRAQQAVVTGWIVFSEKSEAMCWSRSEGRLYLGTARVYVFPTRDAAVGAIEHTRQFAKQKGHNWPVDQWRVGHAVQYTDK